ncbi:G2-specific protein kinase nim-1 [Cytospora mali]|uniref:non-specific serine/threonine protein kinase n=1 Tax=Cytospora mali TaxID=578113 RepID=A0A194VWE2_CYTMA|nr:G2-specific protein kinase nim-1 [Valsa mali]
MSTSSSRPYTYSGVFLPVQTRTDDEGRAAVTSEWPTPRANSRKTAKRRRTNQTHIAEDGFILVHIFWIGLNENLLLVQSVSTGELFLNKILIPRVAVPPLELRISSAGYTDTAGDQDPALQGRLPRDAEWCNQLRFWQELKEAVPGKGPVYSLYFEYCNGGDLETLIQTYNARQMAIPEHFIWLVAEQLCLAVAWMYFGRRPDVANFNPPAQWARIYHRDLWQNNIFIHYPSKPQGRIPGHGLESNAFPHIVLGDFGNSGMDGDPEGEGSFLPINVLPHGDDENARELREWEDIHSIGTILRELCVSQISEDDVRRPDPDKSLASLAASHGPFPYSDRLISLVECFEWDGIDGGKELCDLDDPAAATVSNAQWCLDTLLPAAMQEVAARRNPPGGRPAGYFQGLDVSWTKPQGRMPVSYNPKYAEEADPPPGHVDVDINKVFNTEERNERSVMRKLRGLHALDAVKPPYELRSMDWGVPIIGGANITPPGAEDA